MVEPKIMMLDKIEDIYEDKGSVPNPVIGKLVTDTAGNQLKVKIGRGGCLKKKWDELLTGRAFRFTMGEFKGYPFVENFEAVENVFVAEAQKEAEDKQVITKNRSITLSYAVELRVADRIPTNEIMGWADVFYRYVMGELIVEDETILNLMKGDKNVKTKVKATDNPQPAEEIPTDKAGQVISEEALEQFPMNTKGDLFNACFKKYDLAPTQVVKKLAEIYENDAYSRKDITDVGEAWQKIQEAMKGG